MALANLDLTHEQWRSLVVEALRAYGIQQVSELITIVAEAAIHHNLAPGPAVQHGQQVKLSSRDYGRVLDVIWDMIIEGILRPGLSDGVNNQWPFFHVTKYGVEKLTDDRTPYDPDGYLRRLRQEVGGLDDVIFTYTHESLHTFRIGCLLSSTVMLGCASEKALLLLILAYANSLPQGMKEKFVKTTEGKFIKRQFDEFRKMLDSELRTRLPAELDDGLDVELTALFDFIRTQRNDAGHPTGKEIERERAYANLLVFPVYLRRVYTLIEWVGKNPK